MVVFNRKVIRTFRKVFLILSKRKIFLYSLIYIGLLWVVSTLIFHYIEGVGLFDAFYWAVTTTATVGYGDISAATMIGKVTSIFVMLSGIGVLAVLLGAIAEVFIENAVNKRNKKEIKLENHIIICGWDNKLNIATKELLNSGKEIIVIACEEKLPMEHADLFFINGEPCDDQNLRMASVEQATHALISGKTDTETLLTAIAIEKLNPRINTTCIVSDHRVIKALEKSGVDKALSIDEFFGIFFSRSVHVPFLTAYLNEIMSIQGMDIYQSKVFDELIGISYLDAMILLKEKYDAQLNGIVRGEKIFVNMKKDDVITEDDQIIYIAEREIVVVS